MDSTSPEFAVFRHALQVTAETDLGRCHSRLYSRLLLRWMIGTMSDRFRWEDLDQRLVAPIISALSLEMQRRASEGERKAEYEMLQRRNAAGYESRFFDFHEQLAEEWADRLFAGYCEAWRHQDHAISPAFLRAVRDRVLVPLIATRTSAVGASYTLRATRAARPPNSVALGDWSRRMNSLSARMSQRVEAEAVACECQGNHSGRESGAAHGAINPVSATACTGQACSLTTAIVYSWDDEEHKTWVAGLGARLRGDGVDVRLDQWHAGLGDRLPEFMERQVAECQIIVIVCTPGYKDRFDGRKGGAGYEGHIIAGEILREGGRAGRFVPVLRTGEWASSMPRALEGVRGVDLRETPRFKEEYCRLLRKLFGQSEPTPELGTAPEWLRREMAAPASPQPVTIRPSHEPPPLTVSQWIAREREKALRGMRGGTA